MPNLDLLQADMSQTIERANSLRAKSLTSELSDTESLELSNLHVRGLQLKTAIADERKRILDSDMADLEKFQNGPSYKVSRSVNNDDDGKKTLINAGWEVKGGMVHIPTSMGKSVPMYSEEVLFGAIPSDDKDAAEYFVQSRSVVQPIYRQAYTKYLHLCGKNRSESMAFMALTGDERKALSEGVDGSGGYLVPPDLQAEILVRLGQKAVIRSMARVVNTSRDRVVWPRILPHGDTTLDSIYSSGFVGGWVGETPAFSETDPGFGQFEVSIKKVRVATKLSNDFVADSITDITSWLAMNGSENLALVEDAGFISGVGGALQPQGLLNDPDLKTVDVEGSTANTLINTAASNGSANKLINLTYALPSQYAGNAQWLMRRAIEGKIRQLVDGAGRYLWPAMTDSGFIGRLPPLMGAMVNNSEFMPTDGTDGNKVVVYGDFSNYIIAQRAQMSTVVLRERFADVDQIGIIIFERVGGAAWNSDAFRTGIV